MNYENNLNKKQKNIPENNDFKMTQEEIKKELHSRAMRIDETTEQYQAEEKELFERKKQVQENDEKEIQNTREEIKMITATDTCKKDLLYHFNSPNIDWAGVEGRISSMLSEVQTEDRSEDTYKIIGKVAENIVNWLKQNTGKYDNQVLASEAIKHAIRQAEENFSRLKDNGQKKQKQKSTGEGIESMFEGIKVGIGSVINGSGAFRCKDIIGEGEDGTIVLEKIKMQEEWITDKHDKTISFGEGSIFILSNKDSAYRINEITKDREVVAEFGKLVAESEYISKFVKSEEENREAAVSEATEPKEKEL